MIASVLLIVNAFVVTVIAAKSKNPTISFRSSIPEFFAGKGEASLERYKSTKGQQSAPFKSSGSTNTLLEYQYGIAQGKCSSNTNPTLVFGTSLGVCAKKYGGGSERVEYTETDDQGIHVSKFLFTTPDCSGTPTQSDYVLPTGCHTDDQTDVRMQVRYEIANGTDLSFLPSNGIIFSYHDTRANCLGHFPQTSFYWFSLNTCIPGNYDYLGQFYTSGVNIQFCENEYREAGLNYWDSSETCAAEALGSHEFYLPTCYHLDYPSAWNGNYLSSKCN